MSISNGKSFGPSSIANQIAKIRDMAMDVVEQVQQASQEPAVENSFTAQEANPAMKTGQVTANHLTSFVDSGSLLERPATGESVNELQTLLNRAGVEPALSVDGDFGGFTQRAVKIFQHEHGLEVDGIVGPETMAALARATGLSVASSQGNASAQGSGLSIADLQRQDNYQRAQQNDSVRPTINTNEVVTSDFAPEPGRAASRFASTREERELQANQLAQANGFNFEEGRVLAIQIDQDNPPASANSSDKRDFLRSYSGETSIFKVENGRLVEVSDEVMRSAAHPSAASISDARYGTPNVDGRGNHDVAHLPSGLHEYRATTSGNRFNPTGNQAVFRDTSGDGVVSESEMENHYYSANHRFAGTGIQIHAGRSDRPSSVGCQTMPPSDYNRFVSTIASNRDGARNFSYLVVRRENDNPELRGGTRI